MKEIWDAIKWIVNLMFALTGIGMVLVFGGAALAFGVYVAAMVLARIFL